MKTKFCNLVILSPSDSRIRKIHISRDAAVILILAFVIAFCVMVGVSYSLSPENVGDTERTRLLEENQSLEIANKNAEIRTKRLEAELKKLEGISSHINALVETD